MNPILHTIIKKHNIVLDVKELAQKNVCTISQSYRGILTISMNKRLPPQYSEDYILARSIAYCTLIMPVQPCIYIDYIEDLGKTEAIQKKINTFVGRTLASDDSLKAYKVEQKVDKWTDKAVKHCAEFFKLPVDIIKSRVRQVSWA